MIRAVSPGYFGEAPLVILICADPERDLDMAPWRRDFIAAFDTGSAAENMALAAVALGLGSCFVKAYSEVALKQILKIPEHVKIQIMIAVGYAAPAHTKPIRREPEPAFVDRYGRPWSERP